MNLKAQFEMFRKARRPNRSIFEGKCSVSAIDTMFKYIDVLEEDLESAESLLVKAEAAVKKLLPKRHQRKKLQLRKRLRLKRSLKLLAHRKGPAVDPLLLLPLPFLNALR